MTYLVKVIKSGPFKPDQLHTLAVSLFHNIFCAAAVTVAVHGIEVSMSVAVEIPIRALHVIAVWAGSVGEWRNRADPTHQLVRGQSAS